MELAKATELVSKLEYLPTTGSTNTDLISLATSAPPLWPDLSVLCTSEQTAGKGRAGRTWESRSNASLSVSILVRPTAVQVSDFSWLPILAGLAMTRAVSEYLDPARVMFKWPNDVLVDEKKISGVLSEMLPDASGVIIGAGLNLNQAQSELPIEAATSMQISGASVSFESALESYLRNFVDLYKEFVAHQGNSDACGLRVAAQERCSSIGRLVRVELPGGQSLQGEAVQLDSSGHLMVSVAGEDKLYVVSAGDIVHLRHN